MAKLLSTPALDGLTELCPMVAHMVDNPLSGKLPFMRRMNSIFRLCARPRQSSEVIVRYVLPEGKSSHPQRKFTIQRVKWKEFLQILERVSFVHFCSGIGT